MSGPLVGVRVVEIAGRGGLPLAAMLLADMGADVVRVEREGSTRVDLGPDAALRGRRSIVVDLNQPRGRDVVIRLAQASTALIEGFRPGVAEALGIGPQVCCVANPALVYGRLSGWGQNGPLAGRAGHDLNFLAATGVLDGPALAATSATRPLITMADRSAPALLFAFGLVCAIFEARESGHGQVLDCAAVDAALVTAARFGVADDPAASPPTHLGAPFYGVYATADGHYLAVAAIEAPRYRALLAGLGLDAGSLGDQHDAATWPAARDAVAVAFAGHEWPYWAAVFAEADAGVTLVRTPTQAREDPQLRARGSFTPVAGRWQPAVVPQLSRTPGAPIRPRPVPGQHAREVLADADYSEREIDELIAAGAVPAAAIPDH
jgi:alpha-methylacyl-CoA racemase